MDGNLRKALAARNLTDHIEVRFRNMPWKKSFLLNAKQSYWELLSFLYVYDNGLVSKSECKRKLSNISQNAAEYQLNQLIELGVLNSERNPHDRRARSVKLSPETRQSLDEFFDSIEIEFHVTEVGKKET